MYNFTFKGTNLHKICNSYALITKIHTLFDVFSAQKLHLSLHFLSFFTLLRVKTIDKITIAVKAHG